jgi:hypothetical protein
MTQVVQHLPAKFEALSSNPKTTNKKKNHFIACQAFHINILHKYISKYHVNFSYVVSLFYKMPN